MLVVVALVLGVPVAVVHVVVVVPVPDGPVAAVLGVSQPLVSQHLRVLRSARLVGAERRGREVAYSLLDEHVGHIVSDAIRHTEEDPP